MYIRFPRGFSAKNEKIAFKFGERIAEFASRNDFDRAFARRASRNTGVPPACVTAYSDFAW